MFTVIRILISGFFVGALARWFYPGRVPMDFLPSIALGVGGAFVGGLIAYALDREGSRDPFHRAGCLMSVIGGCILIFVVRTLQAG
jgi:uncharacterized membrane protein YeaQ/YmgE (transglycosylase-associated protein family)